MWIALVLAVVAAAVSAAGMKMQYNAAEKSAKYNAKVNEQNAKTATEQSLYDAEQIRAKNKRVLGAQRAAYAASGVDPDSATSLDVAADTAQQGEMDALTAIYTGQMAATGHQSRARLNRMEAMQNRQTGNIAVAGSLLTSASNYAANPSFR